MEPRPAIPTASAVFDSAMIELLWEEDTNEPRLLLVDGGAESVGPIVGFKGRSYRPPSINPSIWSELRLPTHSKPHKSTRLLADGLCELVIEFIALPERVAAIVARFVLASWLIEATSIAPGLAITGPDLLRGTQLLSLLHCLCRHPVRMSGVSPARLCSLPSGMGFTLLISQSTFSEKLRGLLDDASRRDQKIPRQGGLLDLYGCQVLHSELVPDFDSESVRFLQVPMLPQSSMLPKLDVTTQRRIAADFQPKLLGFRIANIHAARNLQVDPSGLSYPLRGLAQTLAVATPDQVDMRAEVFDLLRDEEVAVRSARWTDLSATVIEAVLLVCHERKELVYIGEIAKIANGIRRLRGENAQVDPGTVGKRLKLLGFSTENRDAHGVRLHLTTEVCNHAQHLAADFEVPTVKSASHGSSEVAKKSREAM